MYSNEDNDIVEKAKELEGILTEVKGKILIIDHFHGDPDSIASKYTWRYELLKRFNIESEIAFSRKISDSQTQFLVKKLDTGYDFKMKDYDEVELANYEKILLLDTNMSLSNNNFQEDSWNKLEKGKIIAIDHHGKKVEKEYPSELCCFEDIIEPKSLSVCSTSTRTIEYLDAWGDTLSQEENEQSLLAAALKLGIETDSSSTDLGKLPRDHMAIVYIWKAINHNILNELKKTNRSETSQDAFAKAIAERVKIENVYAIGCAGFLAEEEREVIREVAEELIMEESIEAGIGFCIIDNYLSMSIRTRSTSRKSAENIANKFGGDGRTNAAGAIMDLGEIFSQCKRDDDMLKFIRDNIISYRISNKK